MFGKEVAGWRRTPEEWEGRRRRGHCSAIKRAPRCLWRL